MKKFFLLVAVFGALLLQPGCKMFHHPTDNDDNHDSTGTKPIDTNYSIKLNGYSSYLQVPSKADLQLCNSDYTIETWVYFSSWSGDWQVILAKDNMDSQTEYLLTADRTTGKFRFQTRNFNTVLYSSTPVSAGKWFHIAAVQDLEMNTVRLYVNGVEEDEKTLRGSAVVTDNPIRIGTRINDITAGSPWYVVDGNIDEIRIWNTARTEDQIKAAMKTKLSGSESGLVAYWNFDEGNGTSAADKSGHLHTATFVNGPAYSLFAAPMK